jgi:hypothetical protein
MMLEGVALLHGGGVLQGHDGEIDVAQLRGGEQGGGFEAEILAKLYVQTPDRWENGESY